MVRRRDLRHHAELGKVVRFGHKGRHTRGALQPKIRGKAGEQRVPGVLLVEVIRRAPRADVKGAMLMY